MNLLASTLATCLAAASPIATATTAPHPLDRPLADVTVMPGDRGVELMILLNFKFIDAVLQITGDPDVVPKQSEIDEVRQRLGSLFANANRVRLNGRIADPQLSRFEFSQPQREVLEREEHLSRPLSQVRFLLSYESDEALRSVDLRWSMYPEHAIYDVPDSPVAPITVQAVVVRDDATQVLKFSVDTPEHRLILGVTPPSRPATHNSPSNPASVTNPWSVTGIALLGLLVAGLCWIAFAASRSRALPLLLLLGTSTLSCAEASTAEPRTAETKNFLVSMETTPAHIPVNEHFTFAFTVRAKSGEKIPGQIAIGADMPAHGHGMNTEPRLTELGNGRWLVEGMLFHMPGAWEIYVYIGRKERMERAVFPVGL